MELMRELAVRLAIPGLPEWTGLLGLLLVLLIALAFVLMPFAVFGLKGRLDAIEAQLDALTAEVRALGLRGNEAPRRSVAEEWSDPPVARRATEPPARPAPIPPPATWPERRGRAEPRFDRS